MTDDIDERELSEYAKCEPHRTPEDLDRIYRLYDVAQWGMRRLAIIPVPSLPVWQAGIYIAQEAARVGGLGPNGDGYDFCWPSAGDPRMWPYSQLLNDDAIAICNSKQLGGPRKRVRDYKALARLSYAITDGPVIVDGAGRKTTVCSDTWATWLAKTHYMLCVRGHYRCDLEDRLTYEYKGDLLYTADVVVKGARVAEELLRDLGVFSVGRQWLKL